MNVAPKIGVADSPDISVIQPDRATDARDSDAAAAGTRCIAPGCPAGQETHATEMVRNSNFEASSNKDDDMSRGYPSMTALLGLLAIAGYQNRDKIAEMLRGAPSNPPDPAAPTKTGAREATPGLGGILGGASIGDTLSGGLRELVDAFRQKGQGDVADSWVARGPNKQIAPAQLEQTIGADVLQTLSQQTGMSREEIVARLSKTLPDAVDKYTSEGRIPSAADFS